MKGVVLAGGLGTRLLPLTRVTNKHLLPVYRKPMIYYPIEKLAAAGIDEIMVVTGGPFAGDFLRLLKNGRDFGLRDLRYTHQEGEGGIAEALRLTEHFAAGDRIAVILGDNLFEDDLAQGIERFRQQKSGAKLYLKEVPDPERFGVAELDAAGRVVGFEEKPAHPKSDLIPIGVYFLRPDAFAVIDHLAPSGRGEFEITDVLNHYIPGGGLFTRIYEGHWTDAGTVPSLLRASEIAGADHIAGHLADPPEWRVE